MVTQTFLRVIQSRCTGSTPQEGYLFCQHQIFVQLPIRGRKRDSMVRVISVGRLIPWKGHRYLIDAVKILNDRTPHCVSLTIVGSGSEAGFLKSKQNPWGCWAWSIF